MKRTPSMKLSDLVEALIKNVKRIMNGYKESKRVVFDSYLDQSLKKYDIKKSATISRELQVHPQMNLTMSGFSK